MDKILYEEIILVPVGVTDFKFFNKVAEERLLNCHPNEIDFITEDCQRVYELAKDCLKSYQK
jgi:hypothetical protein